MTLFRTIPLRNTFKGKVIFATDVHGQLGYLQKALSLMDYKDPVDGVPVDMIFGAGDMIDRGDESYLTAQKFRYDIDKFSINGNHELLCLDEEEMTGDRLLVSQYTNGGEWREKVGKGVVKDLNNHYKEMPLAAEVIMPDGKKIGIVHATVPEGMHWDEMKAELTKPNPCRDLIRYLTWERKSVYRKDTYEVHGVDAVVCGHNVLDYGYQIIGNKVHIDTGATFMCNGSDRNRLTLLEYKAGGPILGMFEPHEFVLNERGNIDYI